MAGDPDRFQSSVLSGGSDQCVLLDVLVFFITDFFHMNYNASTCTVTYIVLPAIAHQRRQKMFISLGSNKIFICFFFYKLQFLLPLQFQTHTTLPAIKPYDFHHLFLEIFELPLNYAPAFLQLYFSEFPVFYTK